MEHHTAPSSHCSARSKLMPFCISFKRWPKRPQEYVTSEGRVTTVTGKFAPTNNQELLIIINSEYCIGYKTRERH